MSDLLESHPYSAGMFPVNSSSDSYEEIKADDFEEKASDDFEEKVSDDFEEKVSDDFEEKVSDDVEFESEQLDFVNPLESSRNYRHSLARSQIRSKSFLHDDDRRKATEVAKKKRIVRHVWRTLENIGEWYFQTLSIQALSLFLTVLSCALYVLFTYLRAASLKECYDDADIDNCEHTAELYSDSADIIMDIQIVITLTFAVDFMMALIIAPSISRYLLSAQGFVDVISLLPLLDLFSSDFYALSFTRFLRLTKAFTILRQQMIGKFGSILGGQDDMRFNVFLLAVKVTGIFFITASIIYALNEIEHGFGPNSIGDRSCSYDNRPNPICYWHDAFYMTVVTLTTVGYGDIYASSPLARISIFLIILISFAIIPFEVSQLADAYSNMPKSRIGYKLAGLNLHVIITTPAPEDSDDVGFESEALRRMLEDLIHENHGPKNKNLCIVVMSPSPPCQGIKTLLKSPQYKRRVLYYRGSIQNPLDLTAVGAEFADCIMIMFKKKASLGESSTVVHSEQVLMSMMALKRYLGRAQQGSVTMERVHRLQEAVGHPKRTRIMVVANRESDLEVLQRSEVDVIINREALKLAMLAQATVAPAFMCFASNCLRASGMDGGKEEVIQRQFYSAEKGAKSPLESRNEQSSGWLKGYLAGASYEMYTMTLKVHRLKWINNKDFMQVAYFLYLISKGKVILMGAMHGGQNSGCEIRSTRRGEFHGNLSGKEEALIAPSNLYFRSHREYKLATVFVLAETWNSARDALDRLSKLSHSDGDDVIENFIVTGNRDSINDISDEIGAINRITSTNSLLRESSYPSKAHLYKVGLVKKSVAWINTHPHVLQASAVLDQIRDDSTVSVRRVANQAEWESYRSLLRHAHDFIKAAVHVHAPELPEMLHGHVIILADHQEWLKRYIIPLRRRCKNLPLVLVTQHTSTYTGLLKDLEKAKELEPELEICNIYCVNGDRKDVSVIERTLAHSASAAVLLSSADVETDSDILLTFFALERYLQRTGGHIRVLVDVQHERNIYFLRQNTPVGIASVHHTERNDEREVWHRSASMRIQRKFSVNTEELADSMYMWPIFAAGGVWTESILNSLCMQVYFNDHLLEFWEALCTTGVNYNQSFADLKSIERGSQSFIDNITIIRQPYMPPPQAGQFQQVLLLGREFIGKTYGSLVQFMFENDCIPLGLYRPPGHNNSRLFYTQLNPPDDEVLVIAYDVGKRITDDEMHSPKVYCDRVFFLRSTSSATIFEDTYAI